MSDGKPAPFTVKKQAIGIVSLSEGRLFYTDDPDLQKHIEYIAELGLGEFSVELLKQVDCSGHEEWLGLEMRRGELLPSATSEQVQAVVDSGFLVLGCPSILSRPLCREAMDALRDYCRTSDNPHVFLSPGGGTPKAIALAAPYGDGAYPLRIDRSPGGTMLTLLWGDMVADNAGE